MMCELAGRALSDGTASVRQKVRLATAITAEAYPHVMAVTALSIIRASAGTSRCAREARPMRDRPRRRSAALAHAHTHKHTRVRTRAGRRMRLFHRCTASPHCCIADRHALPRSSHGVQRNRTRAGVRGARARGGAGGGRIALAAAQAPLHGRRASRPRARLTPCSAAGSLARRAEAARSIDRCMHACMGTAGGARATQRAALGCAEPTDGRRDNVATQSAQGR